MLLSASTASRLNDIANLMLIVSLIAGVISTGLLVWSGHIKEDYLQRELANAGRAAAEANERAVRASLELERFKAPRVLSGLQLRTLVKVMSEFKGQLVSVAAVPATLESSSLAQQIVQALSDAGLRVDINQAAAEMHVGLVAGIVAASHTGNPKGKKFAASFAQAMTELGMPANWTDGMMESIMQRIEKTDPDARTREGNEWVLIVVGAKP